MGNLSKYLNASKMAYYNNHHWAPRLREEDVDRCRPERASVGVGIAAWTTHAESGSYSDDTFVGPMGANFDLNGAPSHKPIGNI